MRKWQEAHDVSQKHGESFFIFDKQRFTDNLTNFRNAFRRHYPRTEIAYSYKTRRLRRSSLRDGAGPRETHRDIREKDHL
jgi:hypothetical protein